MSATAPNATHPWLLVAPWWRWARQKAEDGRSPRQTRPVFQKYETTDFVNVFLKEPQRSLQFFDEVDRVQEVDFVSLPPLAGFFNRAGVRSRLFQPPGQTGKTPRLVPGELRKLFLETHQRFYLVVCELHCDRPGLPSASADEVCQAGLVVRRQRTLVPAAARKEGAALLREITTLRGRLGMLEAKVPLRPFEADKRTRLLAKMAADGSLATQRGALQAELAAARAKLAEWQQRHGVASLHEGWIADPARPHIGAWQPVEEAPATLEEASFPLYHLFADPRDPDHDARGKTIYFGLVPVGGSDTDVRGETRFDDTSRYEVRCFVRRHKPECPRRDEAPDCHGELVWSEPSEAYKLANQNDLLGTSQRPVTVQLPDLNELAAQVAALPFGKASPMKFVQPQGLNFDVDDDGKPGGPRVGGKQICFFAIPLITIVAYFVLNLFLPVLVFLFGLFFLLQLKFCIPPSFKLEGGLQTELDVSLPQLEVEVGAAASLDVVDGAAFAIDVGGGVTLGVDGVHDQLRVAAGQLTGNVTGDLSRRATSADADHPAYTNAAVLPLVTGLHATTRASYDASLDLDANIEFEPRVTAEVQLS